MVEIVNGEEVRPIDISITKNVAALFVSVFLVAGIMLWLAAFHRRNRFKAPRKGLGAVEACVTFIYGGVIKPTLGPQAKRFAPYLMTVFFFILAMNLLGLIVVFPGGANLTGNIAVTLVLSIITFVCTNLFANKHYWKEIFWPDVPVWLKCPLPIMQLIEVGRFFTMRSDEQEDGKSDEQPATTPESSQLPSTTSTACASSTSSPTTARP